MLTSSIRTAKATTPIEVTRVFSSLTYDGRIMSDGSTYVQARNATDGTVSDTTAYDNIGQNYNNLNFKYYVWRGFLFFDTSILPTNINITSATLSLYIYDNNTINDFDVTIQTNYGVYPSIPLDSGDYWSEWYFGDGGSRNTATITSLNYWNITLNTNGINWIKIDGITKFCLRSNKDINNITATTSEFLKIYFAEKGEAYSPKLYVTYETGPYHYIVHGPYYENGNVYSGIVNVTLFIENMDSYSFTLNGSGGADTEDILIGQPGVYFVWNWTGYINMTRVYYLISGSFFDEFYVCIPNPNNPAEIYTFTVTDFAGVTNAYLESVISVGGSNRIVERQKIGFGNIPFIFTWSNRYDIRLVCDQGTYTWGGFIALSEYSQSLIITQDMFPATHPGLNVTVSATRENATWISISYVDNAELTMNVAITIKYKSGTTWTAAYLSGTLTGSIQTINWYSASSTVDYVVYVTAYRQGNYTTWSFSCPTTELPSNPWEGLLEALGTWPIPPAQIFGLFIVLAVFGAFSYASAEAGCVLGVLTAGLLYAVGWLQIASSLLALAGAIAILFAISKAKEKEREI